MALNINYGAKLLLRYLLASGSKGFLRTASENRMLKKFEIFDVKALAKEILNDWDAVAAFVKNPELPPTNNDAERALRQVVTARKISFGTRTTEGSKAYTSILSVIETCRLRNQDPWAFIAQTISMARKGIKPESIPIV